MSSWSPEQYDRFKVERRQPFHDLLAMVEPRPGMRVVDLGCGTGELTRVVAERLSAVETLGIDSSAAMLAESDAHAGAGVRFERRSIEEVTAEGAFDLVFSNAALHWVEDHPQLLARLRRALGPGGQLAVQVPANHDQPSHLAAAEVAADPRFAAALGGYVGHRNVLAAERYAAVLHGLGFARQRVELRVYGHELPGVDAVVEWVKGTTLTAFAERLGEAAFSEFLSAYRQRLVAKVGEPEPFFFGFKRILMWGALPA